MTPPVYMEVGPLLFPRLTGVSRFTAHLVAAVARHVPLRLTSFVDPHEAERVGLSADLVRGHEIRLNPGELPAVDHDITGWARALCRRPKHPYDIAAAGGGTGIYTWWRGGQRRFGREIGIFYDFTPLVVPWSHTPQLCREFEHQVAASRLYDKVVAISHSTKHDAAWLSPVPPDDVSIAYPGPSQCVSAHASPAPVTRRGDRILVVSTREPRKNGEFLFDWFLNTQVLADDVELWWAGPQGWLWDGTTGHRAHERLERIKLLGMVSDARLCELYREASLTIYPSLYEGFGFPVLDSLWHETPVISSCNSSLEELACPGVYYFDPCDARTLDAAYHELMAAWPIKIDRTALEQRFCWEAMAQSFVQLAA